MPWTFPRWRPGDTGTTARASLWRIAAITGLALGGTLLLLAAYVLAMVSLAPGVNQLKQAQSARASVLLSVDGKPLASFSRAQQEPVTLAQVSPHVLHALLATEDHRFYEHRGVDLRRTVVATWRTLTGNTQGGSTITQQLARNLFPDEIGRARSVNRKLKEIVTALRIERSFDKQRILETYLNSAPFLYNVVGIEMAARTYFDKSAAELDVLESATLIGMLKGTSYYNPVSHPERAKTRRNVVLGQMAKHGLLSDGEYRKLMAEPMQVTLTRQPDAADSAPHFANQARKWLLDWADEHDYNVYTDGLVVQTTLDSRLQDAATRAVERQARALQAVADVEWAQAGQRLGAGSPEAYASQQAKVEPFAFLWKSRPDLLAAFAAETPEYKKAVAAGATPAAAAQKLLADSAWLARLKRSKTRLEAGFMAIDPASGEIRAWVGSRDFDVDQFDHVAQAARQPGSTFKPFVYGAALESGIGPERSYLDGPVEVPLGNGKIWRPTDMDAPSNLLLTLRDGLVYSKNTITVQVSQEVGIPRIVALAQAMGVDQSKLDPVPSLALGTSPVTLAEMVSAYATIARQGEYHKPLMVKRITDRHGAVLADFGADSGSETRRALSVDSAVELIDMMRGVVTRGTGTWIKARFGIGADVAGKTGTTQNNTDGWFILMRPGLVGGAWVGFNDSRVTMRSSYWGQGGHNAVLIVGEFFRDALKNGFIDSKASFPPSRRPLPREEPLLPPDPDTEAVENALRGVMPGAPAASAADATERAAVRRDWGAAGPMLGDRAGVSAMKGDDTPPKSADELERAIGGMGNPSTPRPHNEPGNSPPGAPVGTPVSAPVRAPPTALAPDDPGKSETEAEPPQQAPSR